ncbi:MAG: beta-hexosaminidase, partial [Pseudomonadota bacterium]
MHAPRALIVGLAGTELSEAERRLFAEARPAGFILFQRNCRDPEQLERLVTALHEAVPDWRPMVFIDQEGGRVARLKPPGWPAVPALRAIGDLAAIDRGQPRAAPSQASRVA